MRAMSEAIDDDQLEAWPDFFRDDCRYLITTAENVERGLPIGADVRHLARHAARPRALRCARPTSTRRSAIGTCSARR